MANVPLSNLPVATGINGTTDYVPIIKQAPVGGTTAYVDSRVPASVLSTTFGTNFAVGTVTTLPYNMPATITITGAAPNQFLNLGIPQGIPGASGSGSGNVSTQGSVTTNAVAVYADTTGTNIKAGVPATVRATIGAAASGANSDITSLTGLTTALAVTEGGTGVTTSTGSGNNVLSTSPALTSPTVTTQTTGDNSTFAASTGFVQAQLTSTLSAYATLASPALTGVPTAPTVSGATDNTTKIATTAFVQAVLSGGTGGYMPIAGGTFTGTVSGITPSTADNTTKLSTTAYVQSNLSTYAPLNSPALTGNPAGPTQLSTDNSTRLATTAFVNAFVNANGAGDGGCYFQYTSNTTCTLVPLNGGVLWINGTQQVVPSGGVALSSTGGVSGGGNVVAATLYYVYAYMSGSTMTLEASTTGNTVDGTGRANKTGDTTRRLVGMLYAASGTPGVFNDTNIFNGVASYFNRQAKQLNVSVSPATTTSTSYVPITGNITFLSWNTEVSDVRSRGYAYVSATNSVANGTNAVDGSAVGRSQSISFYVASAYQPFAVDYPISLTTGAHTSNFDGSVSTGTGTFYITQTVGVRN